MDRIYHHGHGTYIPGYGYHHGHGTHVPGYGYHHGQGTYSQVMADIIMVKVVIIEDIGGYHPEHSGYYPVCGGFHHGHGGYYG